MTKVNQNFTLTSGDTRTLNYTLVDSANAPLNLSGVTTVKWGMSKLKDDGTFSTTPVVNKSLSSGITITGVSTGELSVSLLPADTATLAGNFYHELEIAIGADTVFTVSTGKATIVKDLL